MKKREKRKNIFPSNYFPAEDHYTPKEALILHCIICGALHVKTIDIEKGRIFPDRQKVEKVSQSIS